MLSCHIFTRITGNLPCMSVDEVSGKYTHRHTGMGIVVEDDIYIQDGDVSLHIFPLPQAMQRVRLCCVEVNEEWCSWRCTLYAMQKCGITCTMQAY